MKLSDLLHALRWLGVEEAEDISKTPIVTIIIEKNVMIVMTLARDEEGGFFSNNKEIASNRRIYKIESDL